jgi:hypothetical protein
MSLRTNPPAVQQEDHRQISSEDSGSDHDSTQLEALNDIVTTRTPKRAFRLGYWSVIGLVVNRVIGMSTVSMVLIWF